MNAIARKLAACKPGNCLAYVRRVPGVTLEVRGGDFENVTRLAEILFGLTPSELDDRRAAKWALYRAAGLLPQLQREADMPR